MVLGEPGDIVIEENDDYHYCNQITMKGQIEVLIIFYFTFKNAKTFFKLKTT